MSWAPASIRSELQAMAKLLQARPGVTDLEEKLCNSLLQKLLMMPALSNADLVVCYESLKEANLPDKVNQSILQALDALATSETKKNSAAKLASSGQDCRSLHLYLTAEENAKLSQCSMYEGALVLAKRLKLLGIAGMKETTKKACVGILVWHQHQRTNQEPSVREIYALTHDMSKALHNVATEIPSKAMRLASYPEDPQCLEREHYEASYPVHPPERKGYPNLSFLTNKLVKVRCSASELAQDLQLCLAFLLVATLVFGSIHSPNCLLSNP